jgi:hypothetical protein
MTLLARDRCYLLRYKNTILQMNDLKKLKQDDYRALFYIDCDISNFYVCPNFEGKNIKDTAYISLKYYRNKLGVNVKINNFRIID